MSTKTEKALTKKNLRTLTKNGHTKHLRNASRVIKYGTINFGRNIWLSTAATMIMTLTLIVLSITLVATIVLSETADAMRDRIDITLFFKPETSEETLALLKSKILEDGNVKSAETRTSEEEYQNFLQENADASRRRRVRTLIWSSTCQLHSRCVSALAFPMCARRSAPRQSF